MTKEMKNINLKIDVENIYSDGDIEEKDIINTAERIFEYYMNCPEIRENCCLRWYEYNKISFDFLFCGGDKTHEINKLYRSKDYPADIITFATFADSPQEERFVLDGEIYLGEIIIALDKIAEEAQNKNIDKAAELKFFIAHGLMHLLGFDHQSEEDFDFVVRCQKAALKNMGINYDKI